MDKQIGRPDMTDDDVLESGANGYRRGWKNIPPYSIAAIRKEPPSAATLWQQGWVREKNLAL